MDYSLGLGVCAASFVGGFTQTLAGFGSSLVALPVLACVMPLRVAVPVVCLINLCLNGILTCRLRLHVRGRTLALLLPAAVPGMALGAWGLGVVSSVLLEALLGLGLLTFVWWQWRPRSCHRPAGAKMGVLAGVMSGLFGSLLGANGPPVVAWMACQDLPRDTIRGTLTAYFLLAGIGVVVTQGLGGLVTSRVLELAALGIPALVAGILAGMAGVGRIGEAGFRRLLLLLLAGTGVSFLFRGALAWW